MFSVYSFDVDSVPIMSDAVDGCISQRSGITFELINETAYSMITCQFFSYFDTMISSQDVWKSFFVV